VANHAAHGRVRYTRKSRETRHARNFRAPESFLTGVDKADESHVCYPDVLAYLLSMGFVRPILYTGKELTGRLATLLMFLGLGTHYLALLMSARASHTVPYHDLQGAMSLFGWLLAVTYLCVEIYHRQRTVGAFVMPVILIFFFIANLMPTRPHATGARSMASSLPTRHAEHSLLRCLRLYPASSASSIWARNACCASGDSVMWFGACRPRNCWSA